MRGLGGAAGPSVRTRQNIVLAAWVVATGVLTFRLIEIQVVENGEWAHVAQRHQQVVRPIPAPRGRILDRHGNELAASRWRYEVGIAPNEIRDRDAVQDALVAHLGVSAREARIRTDTSDSWHVVPNRYLVSQVDRLRDMRGIHIERVPHRRYGRSGLARGIVGRVREGAGVGGVEQSMDSVLAGRSGREVVQLDRYGDPIPGMRSTLERPEPGRDVVLTIDQDVQAIVEGVLAAAIDSTGARGGDVVVVNPSTGEIIAMASVFNGSSAATSAVSASYEPGSTIKPFVAAALMRNGHANMDDSVDTGDGSWTINGRTITDVDADAGGWMSMRDILTKSSNVGIAMLATRLTPGELYTTLRDFGLGTPTGIPLPAEASGLLRRPAAWSAQSAHSLSFGYEVSASPLQMAMAFGAVANGGVLMKPVLIREVHGPPGEPIRFGRPRQIRRVLAPWLSADITSVLAEVVDSGTGVRARMSSFRVAGKSGTARATGADGRYESGAYNSSFAAYVPADDPRLLIFVKVDRPQGEYYGGTTAAPMILAMIESLLASRQSPIDQLAWARSQRSGLGATPMEPTMAFAVATRGAPERVMGALAPPTAVPATADEAPARGDSATVPDLSGASLRVAIWRLDALGLRVRLEGGGLVGETVPPAGAAVAVGDTVRVQGTDAVPAVGVPSGAGR